MPRYSVLIHLGAGTRTITMGAETHDLDSPTGRTAARLLRTAVGMRADRKANTNSHR